MDIRIGNGFDVHRLVEDRDLWMCGVKIPYSKGLLGHSDADVALHALADALLGAVALRDIGYHFPDTDPRYAGADSRVLLRRVVELVAEKGYRPGNVDITIMAQAPKMLPHIPAMIANVAARSRHSPRPRVGQGHHHRAPRLHRPRRRDRRHRHRHRHRRLRSLSHG